MIKFIFISAFAFLVFFNSAVANANKYLKGISEFDVVLMFFTENDETHQALWKETVSSLEKIGTVHISEKDINHAESSLPFLLLTIDGNDKQGSIIIFAEAELLINRSRISTKIWELDLKDSEKSAEPFLTEEGTIGFRKVRIPEEGINQSLPERMLGRFVKEYKIGNSRRPVFHIQRKACSFVRDLTSPE